MVSEVLPLEICFLRLNIALSGNILLNFVYFWEEKYLRLLMLEELGKE